MFFKKLAYLVLSTTIVSQAASIVQAMETNTIDLSATGINSNLIESLKYKIKNHRLPGANENDFQPFSYSEFIDLKNKGKISHEQAEMLIDYAYKSGNPILFRKSDQVVSPESYCLNFLWIHASKQNFQENDHLMGANEESFINNILNPIKDWQSKQPKAHLNFWYDDEMISSNHLVIENTKKILSDKGIKLDNLEFQNIRTIDIVKQNSRLFNEDIPVYFRVDFSKILTAQSLMTNSQDIEYVVNIDSDITAVTCEQLFDQKTLHELNELGSVFGSAFMAPEENSFIMLCKRHAYDLHDKIMIGNTLRKANRQITKFDSYEERVRICKNLINDTFMEEFSKPIHQNNLDAIKKFLNSVLEDIDYTPEERKTLPELCLLMENIGAYLFNSFDIMGIEGRHCDGSAILLTPLEYYKKHTVFPITDQDAFYEYKTFKTFMCIKYGENNNGKNWVPIYRGKPMILPSSKFGSIAYSGQQIDALKKSLQKL